MQYKADRYILFCIEPYGRCAMTSSEQAAYLSLPRKRESSITALLLLSPQSLSALRGPDDRAIHTRPQSRRGSLRATTYRQVKDTRALNAHKALRAAPISMGRGETPVELCQQPSVLPLLFVIQLANNERGNLCKKIEPLKRKI